MSNIKLITVNTVIRFVYIKHLSIPGNLIGLYYFHGPHFLRHSIILLNVRARKILLMSNSESRGQPCQKGIILTFVIPVLSLIAKTLMFLQKWY